ncbi:MAG: TonB-dependent receptor [Prolixibacteraceae bacterium]|nr:TonB-dependent receptor [Prolixibacteraceae bacterium]
MKKTNTNGILHRILKTKVLMIMKLTAFFLFASTFALIASGTYSQNKTITINKENALIRDVLKQIEDQSGYFFIYNNEFVDVYRKIDIHAKEQTIDRLLDDIFKGQNVAYSINERRIILSSSFATGQSQQNITITGKVTDSSNAPLPGVSVVVKGTTTGTITDFDGKYTLANVPGDATLVFSFVGMKSQEISVSGKTSINITLVEEAIGIEEVVAIGYGTAKKKDMTGSVGTVGSAELTNRQTTNLSQAIQGAVSGVMVTRDANAPGSSATIRIRGITTIGDNNPLVLIDGIPGNLDAVNPNDVENISVLKDAASASIYGSRAAAGVILVTTKRAKTDQLNFEYNIENGIDQATTYVETANAVGYMKAANEKAWNDAGNKGTEYPTYPEDRIKNYSTLHTENPDLYPDTNWRDVLLNKSAPRQSHILSVTAGSGHVRTKASLGYDKSSALYDGYTFERITARVNNDITINKYLRFALDLNIRRSITKMPFFDPMYHSRIAAPVYAAIWTNGYIAEGKSGTNPYARLKYGGFRNSWGDEVGGRLSIDFTPIKDLKISAIVSPNLNFYKGKVFQKKITYTGWSDPTVILSTIEGHASTKLTESRNDSHSTTLQFLANYTKQLGEHDLNVLAGYEEYAFFYEGLNSARDQFDLTSYPYLDLGSLAYTTNGGNAYENAYRSYFGRIMYNYNNRYLFQANLRYDGSSRFQKDYRWGLFPSFSAGWVISEEKFMKNIPALSFMKIRSSWGTLGNERIGNYPYQAILQFGNAYFFKGNDVISSKTAAQNQYAIPNISWETTNSLDIGVDLGFFENKLSFTGDYYHKTTKDMLLALEIPDYTGFDNPSQNTGKMDTKGWDTELAWKDQIGKLGYSISINVSDFKSIMGNLGGTEFLGDQVKKEGSEFNEWYGYKSDGLFQTIEEVNNSPKTSTSVKPGDIKYIDISGPTGIPDGKINSYDKVLLGGSLPRYMYGGNIGLNYSNFDFSLVFQGVGKQNARLIDAMVRPFREAWGNVPGILMNNYWSMYNNEAQNLKAKYPRLSDVGATNNYVMSDYWLFKGGYLRLKNITIGYTLPDFTVNKFNIKSLRIYASSSDLFSLNHYPKGWDPEATNYLMTKSFIFGASIKF